MTWNHYRESIRDWERTTCTLREENTAQVDKCSSGVPPYRADVYVTDIAPVSDLTFDFGPNDDIKASRGAEACIYDNKDEADEFAAEFADRGGDTVDCYTNGFRIRLTPGAEEDNFQRLLLIRAIFATFASVFAALAVLYSIYHLFMVATRPTRRPAHSHNVSPVSPAARTPHVHRRPLSVADTRMLVHSLPHAEEDGTCPICLEEFQSDSRKTRSLPCTHAYHEECALQWFRKGNASCPYCNYDLGDDLQRLREEHDATSDRRLTVRSSASSETLETGSWPARRNRSAIYGPSTDHVSQR